MRYLSKIATILFWLTSLLVALLSFRFLALGLEASFPSMLQHVSNRKLVFILHISASPVALIAGLYQFLPRMRAKFPGVHRLSGRVYGLAVLVGGLASLTLTIGFADRPVAAMGFAILAILWLGVTVQAIRLAMAGRIAEHQRWMVRSMALTFAAVTLRLMLPLFQVIGGMEYAESSTYVAWLCWLPNLIIAEYFIARRFRSERLPRHG